METQTNLNLKSKRTDSSINNDFKVGDTELIVNSAPHHNRNIRDSSPSRNGVYFVNANNSKLSTTSSPLQQISDNSTTMGSNNSSYLKANRFDEDQQKTSPTSQRISNSFGKLSYSFEQGAVISADERKDEVNYKTNEDVFTSYYRHKMWFVILIRSCCIANVISVCMNTPQTFEKYSWLRYFTLIVDVITGFILTGEAIIKIRSKGFIRSRKAYIRSAGRVLEFIMVFCIIISIILQILELAMKLDRKVDHYLIISFIRVPRPLLLLRVLKSLLNLSLPKTVSLRSIRQIWGGLLFTIYFMTLAAMIGVQMFGMMNSYCVKTNASTTNPQYSDLLIPPTRCSINNTYAGSYKCPQGFACKELKLSKFRQQRSYFSTIGHGLLTVYESASMEGWSSVMYDAMDARHFVYAVLYFICLIFFIAWLARNVFIAIITEAFADLRVQVSRYTQRNSPSETEEYHVLRKLESDDTMELVKEEGAIKNSVFRSNVASLVHTRGFRWFIYLCVIGDAILQGFLSDLDETPYIQIVFTMIFNLEAILKLYSMGVRNYLKSTPCRFEVVLCVGSTVFLPPVVMRKYGFAVFQVLRPFRLVLLWNPLNSFLKRILGSGATLSSLVLFTMSSLVIVSGVTLQLFCGLGLTNENDKLVQVADDFDFHMFPGAMRAIFQVFMAEAWNEVMDNTVYVGGFGFSFLIFPVFVLFHLLAAIILVSVFVALILDNLELNEELKVVKQRRLGEEVADENKELPHRIRVYDRLKPRPKVINMENDTNLPKIRQSFVSSYITSIEESTEDEALITDITRSSLKQREHVKRTRESQDGKLQLNFVENRPRHNSFANRFRKQSSVSALMQEAHIKRMSVYSTSSDTNIKKKSIRRGYSSRTTVSGSKNYRHISESSSFGHPALGLRLTNASPVFTQAKKEKNRKDIDVSLVRQKMVEAQRKKELRLENLRENHPTFDKSLFLFSSNNPIRQFIQKVVHARLDTKSDAGAQIGAFSKERIKRYIATQTYLDWIMMLCTQASCLAMLAETPAHRTFDEAGLRAVEYIFVISSSIELVLKIIADGLFFAPKAFIQDIGSVLHVMVYLVSLIYVIWKPALIPPGSPAQVLLVLRALRPLRVITLAAPLRKVVWILVSGYKDMIKVAILQLVLMFIFASYGVQTLGGKLKRCNDLSKPTEPECSGTFLISIAKPSQLQDLNGTIPKILVPRVWRNPRNFNFDDMIAAFLTLFELLSYEGWTDVRDILYDQVEWYGSLYPYIYIFFAGLIGLTLFIGVIVSSFNENKGIALLTVEQKRWKDLKKKLELAQPLHLPSRPLEGSLRARLFDLFIGRNFNRFYFIIVLINCSTLCVYQWAPSNKDSSEPEVIACTSISIICCAIYVIESILKIYTFTWKGYWLSWRHRLDFVLMIGGLVFSVWTIVACYIGETGTCDESRNLGVAVFIFRFLSLSGKHNTLKMLMLTVVMSLTKSFYTISVLLMIMACYAFTGVILFGSVKYGLFLNENANFRNSFNALITLFRCTTGEDWNKLMHDAMIGPPYCRSNEDANYWDVTNNCGSKWAALIFFHSYYLIVSYIFLNLFIAVVIENFSIFYSTDDDPIMSQQDILHYQEVWNLVDVKKVGYISPLRARFVLRLLKGGLDLEKQKQFHVLHFKRLCAEIERISNGKNVTFHNLLFVLAYKKIDISKSLQLEERLEREELEYAILEEVATDTIRQWAKKVIHKHEESKSKKALERKNSGISCVASLNSLDSLNSDLDEINTSFTSLHSGMPSTLHLQSSSFENNPTIITTENTSSVRRRKGDGRKDYKAEFYSWWDDLVDDEEVKSN